ncbi:regulation of nuclear pre-mRNA domain-containing protein 1B-like isoform X1 [Zingiber officinale]|nr:regulation of nuclear pre-mRNA domain-containing protein 1B-like isoform X1 [Zingiber officinale]
MNSVFNEQILADKLSKLNSTQQCIETLSHWCIFHRKNAEQVTQTWDKQFHSSQKEQKVPFLYLANDILQNSKRTGTEFVSEFWKVLPAALKDVLENGDEHGKNVVSRLVGIWEQRRVFGSRARDLKEVMLGSEPPPSLDLNKKRSRSSVRILRRDSRSMRIKLSIGGTAEKIVSAMHSVLNEHPEEESELNKCKAAIRHVGRLEKDVEHACAHDEDPRKEKLAAELQVQEIALKESIEKLKLVETTRAALVAQLKEAIWEQESELENARTQLQLAQAMVEVAANMQRRLNNEPLLADSNGPSTKGQKKTAAAIAAEVADKLAASTHSQQIMTSVLSTFAAEAAKNVGLATSSNPSNSYSITPPDRRMAAEKPSPISDTTASALIPLQPIVVSTQHQPQAVLVQQGHVQSQPSASQTQFNMYPVSTQQYLQPSGGVMIGLPYTFNALTPPPPSPQIINLARPSPLPQQQQPMAMMQPPPPPPMPLTMNQPLPMNQQPPQFTFQQHPAPPNYRPLQPPGMPFYHS